VPDLRFNLWENLNDNVLYDKKLYIHMLELFHDPNSNLKTDLAYIYIKKLREKKLLKEA